MGTVGGAAGTVGGAVGTVEGAAGTVGGAALVGTVGGAEQGCPSMYMCGVGIMVFIMYIVPQAGYTVMLLV